MSSSRNSNRSLENPCKDADEELCGRYNVSCRWQNAYQLRGKDIPASCRRKRSKSPKRRRSPKKARSPSRCRAISLRKNCKVAKGCSWVGKHVRGGKMIPSLCRGARVAKKSPRRKSPKRSPSRCSKKRKAVCVASPSCQWAKGYKNAVSGKRVSALCRRKSSASRRRSASRSRSASR